MFHFTLQTIFRIGLLVFIGALLTALPWPAIDGFLYVIDYAFGFFYFFNPIIDMRSLFALSILIAMVEGAIYAFDIAIKVINYINTGHWTPVAPAGEGSIGGPGATHPRFTPGL